MVNDPQGSMILPLDGTPLDPIDPATGHGKKI